MYVRFTTCLRDEDSHLPQGIFQAAFNLRDTGELETYELDELNEALDWLKTHLKSPACLREPGNQRAVSWFHPRAKKPMKFVWRIVYLLRDHNVEVVVHKTSHPGDIIYEDGWQVVAKPWRRQHNV